MARYVIVALKIFILEQIEININPINFVISSGILHIFFLSVVLLFVHKEFKYRNRLLASLLIISGFHFTYLMLLDLNLDNRFPWLLWFPYSFLTATGPLLYFYTYSFIHPNFKITSKDRRHFIPVVLELIVQLFQIGWAIRLDELYYNVFSDRIISPLIYLFASISLFYYLRKTGLIIHGHEKALVQQFSEIEKRTLKWLKDLLGYYRLSWLVWILFSVVFLILFRMQFQNILIVSITYLLLIFLVYLTWWMGLNGLLKASSMKSVGLVGKVSSSSYGHISMEEISALVEAIKSEMEEQKLYLKASLSLKDLANVLSKDPNLISFVLNRHIGKTFYEMVNSYRIEAVKVRLLEGDIEQFTLLAIALECGFNSKTSFNRVFKETTGVTPRQYMRKESLN